jgi:DNA-binding CsgD family transcriptional regulator
VKSRADFIGLRCARAGRDTLGVKFENLTDRERECLYLATRFMRPKEIAAQIGGSPRTVETHLLRATRKLGAASPRDAAKMYADYLSKYGSGNTRTETTRLSDSSTHRSSLIRDEDDEQRDGHILFDSGSELRLERTTSTLRRSFIERWKGIDANDLTTSTILRTIFVGAIIAALALATVINLVGAFHQFETIFSRL